MFLSFQVIVSIKGNAEKQLLLHASDSLKMVNHILVKLINNKNDNNVNLAFW